MRVSCRGLLKHPEGADGLGDGRFQIPVTLSEVMTDIREKLPVLSPASLPSG